MGLHQILYTSHSLVPMSNAAAGITGLLLHADGSFMQTIEGEASAVHELFAKIEHDPRHGGIILMCDEPIECRSYGEWSMAFREITREEAARLPGFQRDQKEIGPSDRDLARNLMRTFGETSGFARHG